MTVAADRRFMGLALGLARRGLGRVWPNPAVGCVIVKEGHIVGRGWTQPGGRPHAETVALAQAGEAARGATVYVSLEPCAHHGKTPPCADALIEAGVARVVTALEDPDTRVAGRGHALLREAGINVHEGVMTPEAESLQRGFLTRVRLGRPMVTLKLATSLDGRIATSSGESQWITGELARARVHAMRAAHDAVLVGAGTARADDPSLTVRGIGIDHQPVRIVAARGLDVPLDGKLAKTSDVLPVWLLHGRSAPETMRATWVERGAKLLEVDEVDTGLDAAGMLASLGGEGLTRLFCEGGGELAAALLNADLVDELVLFTGGVALGADGRSAVAALGLSALADAPSFRLSSIEAVGSDTMTTWSRHGTA